ncbi:MULTISPECIES: hypothetical protein [Fusobacterium]|jgi:hypothetical protein|uniref:Uncharacterized protein n=1 Tax=Fusobacterium varium ATCC 27725 TaxID=469618 RepID=A0ABN5JIA9_FUSVA|nr:MULTISPECIES: hypothetical protein [Fusobacterium]AVQ30729.1 hypothetical protein C4N18_05690 [Fusobacterium varium ATCC 27725]EES64154.1 hypothetical protein FVAG_02736 [Fusobacterium varium ATCC 27725]MCD7980599.1 hypothetical protein [Fusobacterium sp.]MDY4004886.1 hypothetical protein [Fusobacterium varium]RHG35596.1 hypothetical protein DW261_08070 [Fusobacterium varium]
MKKIILLFTIIFTITIYSSERTSFRATAVYEVKDPITISSNKNEINFGILLDGQIGRVSGHTLTLTGTGDMNLKYTLNIPQNDIGLGIVEKSKTIKNDGIVYEYDYTWDTQKSKVKNLKGTVITFTASYTE